MINIKRKITLLVALLIIALSLFGCGGNKDMDPGDNPDKETAAASETVDKTTESAVSTKAAVTTDDAVSDKKEEEKNENSSKPETSAKEKSSKTKKKTTKPKDTGDIKCTISVDCNSLYKKDPELAQKVSNKGSILGTKALTLKKNSTVYDALKATGLSFSGKQYISMINGLSEKDGGKLSGWIYYVNSSSPAESCDAYKLKNGDNVQWRYTCSGGDDL